MPSPGKSADTEDNTKKLRTMDPEVGFDPCDLPVSPPQVPVFPSHGMPVMLLSWKPRHTADFVAAGIAAATNIVVTYPVFKAIVRIQMDGTALPTVVADFKQEGFKNLYRGMLPPLLSRTAQVSLMFGLYESYSHILYEKGVRPVSLTAAFGTGVTEALLLTPFETIQTVLSCYKLHSHYKNTFDVMRQLSLRELWTGLGVITTRNVVNAALFFPAKQYVGTLTSGLNTSNFTIDFLCGAGLGAVISSAMFPLHVLKLQLQRATGAREPASAGSLFRDILAERGFLGMYRGVPLHFTRAFISWGIINALYEQVKSGLDNEQR
eukprot:gb/GECG01004171.1/.p1 GENE.gb/GECG01004171.1/~~gb/GECG01004171.1/.p1  ORF type:complete len:322 (+),score=17.90 gb/GECG01004171.1/:1-966(+)